MSKHIADLFGRDCEAPPVKTNSSCGLTADRTLHQPPNHGLIQSPQAFSRPSSSSVRTPIHVNQHVVPRKIPGASLRKFAPAETCCEDWDGALMRGRIGQVIGFVRESSVSRP